MEDELECKPGFVPAARHFVIFLQVIYKKKFIFITPSPDKGFFCLIHRVGNCKQLYGKR